MGLKIFIVKQKLIYTGVSLSGQGLGPITSKFGLNNFIL